MTDPTPTHPFRGGGSDGRDFCWTSLVAGALGESPVHRYCGLPESRHPAPGRDAYAVDPAPVVDARERVWPRPGDSGHRPGDPCDADRGIYEMPVCGGCWGVLVDWATGLHAKQTAMDTAVALAAAESKLSAIRAVVADAQCPDVDPIRAILEG